MRERAYEEYQGDWETVLQKSKAFVNEGNTNLSRVLSLLHKPADKNTNAKLLRFYGHRIAGARVRGIKDDAYESIIFERTVQRELAKTIDSDTVNIIELGSGYSRNLFGIWLNGGPLKANYIGMEYTSSGRECASYLAGLEPILNYRSYEFDYYKPEFPSFDRAAKTFVFTSYSIEQITELGKEVFDKLLSIPGLYRVLHIEPVGWQTGVKLFPFPMAPILWASTRISARRMQYNTNLLKILAELERCGKISLDRPAKMDYLAHRPNLPGSILTWVPRH